jgi:hypothetical protein
MRKEYNIFYKKSLIGFQISLIIFSFCFLLSSIELINASLGGQKSTPPEEDTNTFTPFTDANIMSSTIIPTSGAYLHTYDKAVNDMEASLNAKTKTGDITN